MRCLAREGASSVPGRTVGTGMWGPYNLPPVSRWPGQRHGTGSLLLQQPPGRISWCFSGHALCSCSRLLLCFFFFPGIYPQKLAVPSTLQEPGRPCPGAEAMLQHHQHPPYSIPHPLPCRDAGHHLHRSDGPELILHPMTQIFPHPTLCHSSAQIRPLLQIPEPPEQAEHSC